MLEFALAEILVLGGGVTHLRKTGVWSGIDGAGLAIFQLCILTAFDIVKPKRSLANGLVSYSPMKHVTRSSGTPQSTGS